MSPSLPGPKDVVRITQSGSINAYVTYAQRQLQDPSVRRIQLHAQDKAISKAVTVAEILKRVHPGLHQHNLLAPETLTTNKSDSSRTVSSLSITLTDKPSTSQPDDMHQ